MSMARFRAVILDLDGVVTRTATLHAEAWKEMFDAFLRRRPAAEGEDLSPFDLQADYLPHVDGRPRLDGVRAFLAARGIELPEGSPEDDPGEDTVHALGRRKDEIFLRLLEREPLQLFDDAVERIRRWRDEGLATGLITSSRNGRRILASGGLEELFDVVIDGVDAARLGIAGKPAPDIFLRAASELGVQPGEAIVVEDAIAGVEAGRAGGFGLVVGVARGGGEGLRQAGADVVVSDLRQLRGELRGRREMREWELVYHRWDPGEQPLREALCALGNGLLVTRAAFEEVRAGGAHCPGTYLAGGYNRLTTEIAGREIENEDLVNWPNWLPLTFRAAGGEWFSPDTAEILDFEQRLDLHHGVLERTLRFRDGQGRESRLVTRRIVHLARPHLAAIEWTLTPLAWSGEIELRSGLDGGVANENVARYQELANRHLEIERTGYDGRDTIFLTAVTSQSRVRMSQAARTRVFDGDEELAARRSHREGEGRVDELLRVELRDSRSLRVEKVVAIHTSRDPAVAESEIASLQEVGRAGTFAALLESHQLGWRHLWSISDIALTDGDTETQLVLRLHIFHLLQTVSQNTIDRDVGVPARGWHGEAYRGHVFWDELFIFPFLSLRLPELTRSLLMYRYRRLDEARQLAREAGFRGAMFPWQSGSDGREESQQMHLNPRSGRWLPDESNLQRHVNAAIAYNVWRYHEVTDDREFLSSHGAEMLLEIARFWASIATRHRELDRWEIRGVMGPDEFHTRYPGAERPGLNNNAYTNVMAAWVLRCAGGVLRLLDDERRARLREELRITDAEVERWDEISRKLYVPFHGDGIISQFEGYEKLEEFDWEGCRERHGDIHRLDRLLEAEGDDVNRYQASKQADVLMLFYLFSRVELEELFAHLGLEVDPGLVPRNIDYYLHRTSHGSTLSRVVHYWVMAREDRAHDWTLFQAALRSDIDDVQGGTTHEGIHLGAMAGTVDLVQRCHTGLETRDGVLWLDPRLPRELSDVRLRLHYRGHWLSLDVSAERLTVAIDPGWARPVRVAFRGEVNEMSQGESRSFPIGPR
jgi:beta-phosphoglucomutase family hydrolase